MLIAAARSASGSAAAAPVAVDGQPRRAAHRPAQGNRSPLTPRDEWVMTKAI